MEIIKGLHWAIVPARAGSERFPNKNLANFNGQPLISLACQKALDVERMDRVIVSTDIEGILAKLAIYNGSLLILKRPKRLAQSDTRIDDVLIDIAKNNQPFAEFIHLIQLTSPLITSEHIAKGCQLLEENDVDSVQTVSGVSNVYHAFSQRKIENGMVLFTSYRTRNKCYNSQRKPPRYVFAGYVGCRTISLLGNGEIWGRKSLPIIVPPACAVDIDFPQDLEYAEWLSKNKHLTSKKNYNTVIS